LLDKGPIRVAKNKRGTKLKIQAGSLIEKREKEGFGRQL
jgi:hypothetical protein